jgi:hypothetical protein
MLINLSETRAFGGHVRGPRDVPDLRHVLQVRTEPAVAAEDFLPDDRRDRQTVEAVDEDLPHVDGAAQFACGHGKDSSSVHFQWGVGNSQIVHSSMANNSMVMGELAIEKNTRNSRPKVLP